MQYASIEASSDQEFIEKSITLLGAHLRFATTEKDRCVMGLSGGSTPKPIYAALGRQEGIDWSKVWIFLVDERYVPPDHADSNQKLVRETLLKYTPILAEHCIFPLTSLPLDACISAYERQLKHALGSDSPDIVTLGLGEDGHIASLFPPIPEEAFGPQMVIHTTTDRFAVHDRMSVTLPLLKQSKVPVFFLKGEAKKSVWREMAAADENPRRWPALAVLEEGRVTVVVQS